MNKTPMQRLGILTITALLSAGHLAAQPTIDTPRERRGAWTRGEAMIVQPARPLTDLDRAELAEKGILLRQALPGERFLARVTGGADVSDSRLTSVERLTPAMKLQRSAVRELERGSTWLDLSVTYVRDVTFEEARQSVLAAGGALTEPFATEFLPMQRLDVRVPRVALDALSRDQRVLAISAPLRFKIESHNVDSAKLSKVDVLHEAPYGLTGEGVTVSLFELSPAQDSHPEFEGRLTNHMTGGSDPRHATHVAGTIGAAGITSRAKGMAPKAKIEQFIVPSNSKILVTRKQNLPSFGIVVDNNSWGYVLGWSVEDSRSVWNNLARYYGAYELEITAALDQISNEKNILFVHSAGNDGNGPSFGSWSEHLHVDEEYKTITDQVFCYSNDGSGNDCPASLCTAKVNACEKEKHHTSIPYDTMGMTASGKNVIAVASVGTQTNSSSTAISDFSSRGPAKDGRVKPDVAARGRTVYSSVPGSAYGTSSGTSMAAPAVTGIAALLTEQWRRTYAGATPTPAQLKALIIAGAEDLGLAGPDYTFGFGLVNAKKSVDFILADEGRGSRIRNLSVSQGQKFEIPMTVTAAGPLRVILQWPDPAIPYINGASDIADKALVNDLDVHLVGPQGTIHLPYVLDKNSVLTPASRGVNTVDNTEMLEIANAAPGVYRVVVSGTRVAEGPQKAVVVTTSDMAPPCVDLQEPNDSVETAHGNLVPGQMVTGAICSQGDLDYFKFEATKSGAVSVAITAGDTAIRATLTGNGANATVEVPAGGTASVTHNVTATPFPMILKLEAVGALGAVPTYIFTPEFGVTTPARRRSSR
jgi:subtilisin family serine protease